MSTGTTDVIDLLAGIEPGSPLHAIRDQRPQARENAQKSYLALFEPEVPGNVTALERFAVATFVAGLHRQAAVSDFYAASLRKIAPSIADAVIAEVTRGATRGPYGSYPEGPLSVENKDGLIYRVPAESAALFGPRLTAAFEHAHLLVFHPRDASPEALQKLLDAGWSTTDIVTLSQLVSFLAFQIRVIAGLSTLASTSTAIVASSKKPFTGALASGHI
ncbi:CMD domain protein [Microvirga terricola]|uniref:CMD domain protein n=1 Tax=Microvirga terricola TaxID=2719797 RepID=A0ABX0VF84_9HYPH|nr:CMD domain protein [Microvirga terricola]NIX77011.1 CMD domain protein [Microvirga terricola]